jgi:nucleoid-associated protein YgaU
VSKAEDEWRAGNMSNYQPDRSPLLCIRYVGVWDTVGALGIPAYIVGASFSNREYQFHDLKLSSFVESARHAVAIDERKLDFRPTLWENLDDLNAARGAASEALDAPYQQKWFPGNHGSVGGGGDQRGLSDQALDWVWDGARHAGLRLDTSPHSRIYELAPSDMAPLDNTTDKPNFFDVIGIVIDMLPVGDREPGPRQLHEVSVGARRRWHRQPDKLPEAAAYRPRTLEPVRGSLDALDPGQLGMDALPPDGSFIVHEVARDETLTSIAVAYYHDAGEWPRIFEANKYKIDDPDKIYVGQVLRIPS